MNIYAYILLGTYVGVELNRLTVCIFSACTKAMSLPGGVLFSVGGTIPESQ